MFAVCENYFSMIFLFWKKMKVLNENKPKIINFKMKNLKPFVFSFACSMNNNIDTNINFY